MHLPMILFGVFTVLGIAALIFYTQKLNRDDKKRWKDLK
jgi:hypothetical protein